MAIRKAGGTPRPVRPTGTDPKPGPKAGAAGDAKKADKPTTLEGYLQQTGKSLDDLKASSWSMESAARALLQAKGIDVPTKSQLVETTYQLNEAIAQGKWKSFSAPFQPSLIQTEDNVNQRLGNIFFEKHAFSEHELRTESLKLQPWEAEKLRGEFENGRAGMVMAATFISTRHRAEGDFSRAYGDEAWRGFQRATHFVNQIPKGEFAKNLDVDTIVKVNELIHAPDTGIKAKLLRGIAYIGRGLRWDKGGEIRSGRQFARPGSYTSEEIANFKEAGVKVIPMGTGKDGTVRAMLEYPPPGEVKERLQKLIDDLKAELSKPDADVVGAAARFQRHFVALHPFGDSNGRTSRLLMNRILADFDLPPAILKHQNRDISTSPEQWRREVAEGVARSKRFLSQTSVNSKDTYLAKVGIQALSSSPNQPITLDGSPFDLGQDGFLYDPTGRPWIAAGEELVPLSQLEHFTLSRRIGQMGAEAGKAKLLEITAETRALYDKVAKDPKAGEGFCVRPDQAAWKADASYQLRPEPEVARLLAELCDVDKIDKAQLFRINSASGTRISSTISKHAQVDLELWYVERGLRDTGMGELADKVRGERAKLFDLAKARLKELGSEARVSPENPNGFKFRYEQLMYESSPLKHASFEEALDKDGDDKITVWRGDYSFARLIGMAPNNDVRQPDAKAIAEDRAEKGQVTNLYDDLMKLEGSAVGRQYICTTSDLALLTKSFADSKKSRTVNLGVLPDVISDAILGWIDPDKGAEGMSEAEKLEARKKANDERGKQGLDPLPEDGSKEIKDAFGVPGTLLNLRIREKSEKKVDVTAHRKAFALRLDKDALLPGVVALGGHTFEKEQEMHGLERVYPWHIKGTYSAEQIREELPITDPDKAAMEAMKEQELAKQDAKAGHSTYGDYGGKSYAGGYGSKGYGDKGYGDKGYGDKGYGGEASDLAWDKSINAVYGAKAGDVYGSKKDALSDDKAVG